MIRNMAGTIIQKTEQEIEAALMQHPYLETIAGNNSETVAEIYFKRKRDALELKKRLGCGEVEKVEKNWKAIIPFRKEE